MGSSLPILASPSWWVEREGLSGIRELPRARLQESCGHHHHHSLSFQNHKFQHKVAYYNNIKSVNIDFVQVMKLRSTLCRVVGFFYPGGGKGPSFGNNWAHTWACRQYQIQAPVFRWCERSGPWRITASKNTECWLRWTNHLFCHMAILDMFRLILQKHYVMPPVRDRLQEELAQWGSRHWRDWRDKASDTPGVRLTSLDFLSRAVERRA